VVAVIAIAGLLIAVAAVEGWFSPGPTAILGAGATFPYPLIAKWASVYNSTTVRVNYQGIGSGGGIQQITAKTVDFAASDAPLKPSERAAAPGLLHIPETIGAVTAAYNVAELQTGLNLTGAVLADIFLGRITTWDHANISALNPTVSLPSRAIHVVHRSDSSGTTFVWTSYLHLSSSAWNSSLVGKSINWPTGIAGKGNNIVAGIIQQTPDSIGYVELAYAVSNSMKVAKVRNPAGNFILPSLDSTAAAAASASAFPTPDGDWGNVSILNAGGATSYPIASFTYLLIYKELNTIGPSMTQAKAKALVDFLWYCIHDGQSLAPSLQYPPLPAVVVTLDDGAMKSITYNGVAHS
jgi:phosphate ABC transporter phosphate-binding protein